MTRIPHPAIDVTELTSLAICPVRRCGWRTLQLSETMALLRYHEHYEAKHRVCTPVAEACTWCGADDDVLPRRGICRRCHKAERAEKARATYKQRKRAS